MTPKEKANELIERFSRYTEPSDCKHEAIQCAIIAVDEIILIDNYIDETVFTLFSKYPNIKIKIYTKIISKQLKLDLQKYKTQYQNIELLEFKNSHDRFLILDKKEIYHIGASLKDLGKKWFAFSKFDIENFDILKRLN